MKLRTFVLTMIAVCIPIYLVLQSEPLEQFFESAKQGDPQAIMVTASLYPSEMMSGAMVVSSNAFQEPLIERIEREAELRRIAPINAVIDPIWQAIPGYNGIEVDIERTYKLNEKNTEQDELRFLYRQIEPDIQLDDLGAYPVYKGNEQKPIAGIMINVAWGNEFIPSILRVLEDEHVQATFFFDGSWLSKNMEMARQICEAGHECSNHAYSHKNMSELDRDTARKEIAETEKLLKKLGITNHWFAPPSGDFDQETVEIADKLGLRTVLWTLDTVDWRKPKPEAIVKKIDRHVKAGTLILMHPTESSSLALQQMIRAIKGHGLALGTVSQVLSSQRVSDIETGIDF